MFAAREGADGRVRDVLDRDHVRSTARVHQRQQCTQVLHDRAPQRRPVRDAAEDVGQLEHGHREVVACGGASDLDLVDTAADVGMVLGERPLGAGACEVREVRPEHRGGGQSGAASSFEHPARRDDVGGLEQVVDRSVGDRAVVCQGGEHEPIVALEDGGQFIVVDAAARDSRHVSHGGRSRSVRGRRVRSCRR